MPGPAAPARRPTDQATVSTRDRFVGFAFAAADLLVEIDADRNISFAAGAFVERFGQEAGLFERQPISTLIAVETLGDLEIGLSLLAARGRLPPISLRLANPERTQVALSGLCLPNHGGIAWLTFARLPAAPTELNKLASAQLFRHAMERQVTSGTAAGVGLIEVGGWSKLAESQRRDLLTDITQALRQAGGGDALAAELAEGRFGVLGGGPIDMDGLQAQVSQILRAGGAARLVTGTSLPTQAAGLDPLNVTRMLRFALTSFAAAGANGVREAGFAGGLRHFMDRNQTRAAAMRSAIDGGRFRMLYQPVVALADRSVHHFEALLRPLPIIGHDFANTQEYVTFAEAMGLAEVLDGATLRRTVEALRDAKVRVAVNISGLSLQSPAFRERLFYTLAHHGTLRDRLLIELTETADIDDLATAAATILQLRQEGIQVCLDDFGAGFAAFRYLREFPLDFVKIDGSFVRRAGTDPRENGFIGAMVELARCVGAKSIAEMVETEAQAASMLQQGVQYGQGWLFGKPGSLPGSL